MASPLPLNRTRDAGGLKDTADIPFKAIARTSAHTIVWQIDANGNAQLCYVIEGLSKDSDGWVMCKHSINITYMIAFSHNLGQDREGPPREWG